MIFDPLYFILIGPFFILGLLAQFWVSGAFRAGQNQRTSLSGFEVARRILDQEGLNNVRIEEIPGEALADHYDPSERVLRLSSAVYHGRNASAVGVAAHEAGHALQHAQQYAPLVVRNIAVPAAGLGSSIGIWMFILGMIFGSATLAWVGIILFSAVVFFQLVNLPVEFNASSRAKYELANMGVFSDAALSSVRTVLTAAAMTYVAATLQAIMTLVYLFMRTQESQE
ncbi:MAG: zinc metallopeptidase [Planctomycetia bacterium]|nr:zinc metallopeptidase [Planctomycetia bacterium]